MATQKLLNVYTVLNLDYTIERTCDKTGRPSGGASISQIKVTIRAAKQKGTPFHEWINGDDKLMDGEIKIFDSTGIISSTIQDTTGTDTLVDVGEAIDIPSDMMGAAMNTSMDEASDYGNRGVWELDEFDEMSHDDLLEYAKNHDITVKNIDTDDDIKRVIRERKKNEKKVNDMSETELKKYAKIHDIETDKLTDAQLKQKVLDNMNSLTGHEVRQHSFEEAYKAADKMKGKTVSTAKGLASAAAKRFLECARCIEFKNAYCISLKEKFVNHPDTQGKLDSTYPWTLEIGFKPKTVIVTGEQLVGKAIGGKTTYTLY